jgi:hypothetical protein
MGFFRRLVRVVCRFVVPVARILTATTPLTAFLSAAQFGVSVCAPRASAYAAVILNLGGSVTASSLGQTKLAQQIAMSAAISGGSAVDPRAGAALGLVSGGGFPSDGEGVVEMLCNASGTITNIAILVRQEDLAEVMSAFSGMSELCHLPDSFLARALKSGTGAALSESAADCGARVGQLQPQTRDGERRRVAPHFQAQTNPNRSSASTNQNPRR